MTPPDDPPLAIGDDAPLLEPDAPVADEPEADVPELMPPNAPEPDEGVSEVPAACEPDEPELPELPAPDAPVVEEVEGWVPTVAPVLGCIAEEPEVVEPAPVAAGRSVAPDGPGGLVVDWAKAGAAASAVAKRQAAMWVFNIDVSRGCGSRLLGARRVNASLPGSFRRA
jgi:hypothetical protein